MNGESGIIFCVTQVTHYLYHEVHHWRNIEPFPLEPDPLGYISTGHVQ